MQVMIWFLVYLLLIVALATWRSHHDAARRRRRRHHGQVREGDGDSHRRSGPLSMTSVSRRLHRTS